MSLEKSQQPENNEETAKNALEMAGFQIGEKVAIPFPENYPTGEWEITGSTTITTEGRKLSAVIIYSPDSEILITVTLEELCSVNPAPRHNKPLNPYHEISISSTDDEITHPNQAVSESLDPYYETLIPDIGEHLTKDKTIIFTIEYSGRTVEIITGIIHGPIKVGESIVSSLQPPTAPVERIILQKNVYKITTENGAVFYFDPTKPIDDKQD